MADPPGGLGGLKPPLLCAAPEEERKKEGGLEEEEGGLEEEEGDQPPLPLRSGSATGHAVGRWVSSRLAGGIDMKPITTHLPLQTPTVLRVHD